MSIQMGKMDTETLASTVLGFHMKMFTINLILQLTEHAHHQNGKRNKETRLLLPFSFQFETLLFSTYNGLDNTKVLHLLPSGQRGAPGLIPLRCIAPLR
jgi:hypothetical protein